MIIQDPKNFDYAALEPGDFALELLRVNTEHYTQEEKRLKSQPNLSVPQWTACVDSLNILSQERDKMELRVRGQEVIEYDRDWYVLDGARLSAGTWLRFTGDLAFSEDGVKAKRVQLPSGPYLDETGLHILLSSAYGDRTIAIGLLRQTVACMREAGVVL